MSGGGIFYFYRTYTATVSGSAKRHERCVGCSRDFEYEIKRVAQGGGHSGFYFNNAGASASADARARANLVHALDEAIEPVHCPTCGIYQPDMVRVLRKRHGKRFDPNKYAAERIKYPVASLWHIARKMNTKEAYNRFIEVWPTFDFDAKKRISELRYPPHVRKLVGRVAWMLWGALALGTVGIVIAGIVASR
ncbi:MAG: hypothetical protein WAU57_20305 [Xanthobacteraceae bacterium]